MMWYMASKRALYRHCFWKNVPWVLAQRLTKKRRSIKRFCGHDGISLSQSNEELKKALSSSAPFCAIRFGAVEISCLNNAEKITLGKKKTFKESVRYSMKNNAGFFPTDDQSLKDYSSALLPLLSEVDILGVSGVHMENYFYQEYAKQASPILYEGMEPLRGDWVSLLAGKKVLVVSPFVNDVAAQYKKKEKLFGQDGPLPSFELLLLKAPMTFGDATPNKATFFEELEELKSQMKKMDFDVALIGAGAYGNFLAIEAKRMGKQAIQTGGATPTLFGIYAKRWENRPHVKKWINAEWIRPSERPQGLEKIEEGAYW